jgi:hypothetical protein
VSQSICAPAAAATVRRPIKACMLAASQHDRQCMALLIYCRNRSLGYHRRSLRSPRALPWLAFVHRRWLGSWRRRQQRPDPTWQVGEQPGLSWPSCICRVSRAWTSEHEKWNFP